MIFCNLSSSDIIQIIIGSITALALLFTGLSYLLSRHSYKKQYEYNKKVKALDIANDMAILISGDISLVLAPFNSDEFKIFLDDYFSADESVEFDYKSLEERCKKAPLYKYGNVNAFADKYYELIKNYFYNQLIKNGHDPKEAAIKANDKFLEHSQLFCLTLNKIESVSMHFCTEIADEQLVYPSIHQVFLKLIKISSIRISLTNRTSYDEYYKYTIELYRLWNERQIDYLKSTAEGRKNTDKKFVNSNKFKQ